MSAVNEVSTKANIDYRFACFFIFYLEKKKMNKNSKYIGHFFGGRNILLNQSINSMVVDQNRRNNKHNKSVGPSTWDLSTEAH